MSTASVVRVPERFPDVDVVACQHMIMRDAQHLLRPWNEDGLPMDGDAAHSASSLPAALLAQTSHGSVCGLVFTEAVKIPEAQQVHVSLQCSQAMRIWWSETCPMRSATLAVKQMHMRCSECTAMLAV
jgi:hypothetical protein